MKNVHFVLFVGVFVLGAINWKLNSMMFSPEIQFQDVHGDIHQLKLVPDTAYLDTAYLLVPWIDDCPYSKRTLEVMEKIPDEGKFKENPIFAFYLNPISPEGLSNHPSVIDSYLIHSSARQDISILMSMQEDLFEPSGFMPGDIYFVDIEGDVTHMPTRNMDSDEMYDKVLQNITY